MMRKLVLSAGLAALGMGAMAGAAGTSGGIYTEAQAAEGAAIFAERCATCHGKHAEGTWEVPPLKGKFMANWGKGPVVHLFDYLGRAMPQFAPGTMQPADNVKIIAFLLKTNGQPAGTRPLSEDRSVLTGQMIDPLPPATGH